MSEITEWIRAYYGIVILIVIILLLLFWNSLIHFINRKKNKRIETTSSQSLFGMEDALFNLEQESLFEDIKGKDTLDNFQEQRILAERQIRQIKEEGKKLVREEQILINEYRQKKARFERDRKQLGMKYTIWVNQMKMIDEMIANQAKISEEFKRIKEMGG